MCSPCSTRSERQKVPVLDTDSVNETEIIQASVNENSKECSLSELYNESICGGRSVQPLNVFSIECGLFYKNLCAFFLATLKYLK